MGVVRSDGNHRSGDERGMCEVLTSPVKKCTRDRRHLVATVGPTSEISSDGNRTPKSWVTTSVAMNVFLLIAVIYHEWSRSQAIKGWNSNAVDTLKSEISPEITTPQVITNDHCSGHGIYESEYETGYGACRCHQCFNGEDCSSTDYGCILDLYQGDPTMFEKYWLHNGDSCTTTILGWQRMSYYANSKEFFFVQTELDVVIRSLHEVVGNAVTEGRHIVIGVGSTQLFQAALYALSSPSLSTPTNVVSLAPYYSSYPTITDYLRSALYRWAGDAATFKQTSEDDAYIELVTTPNNPTGEIRYPVVNGTGAVVHDLAYYWPHYIPITAPADDRLMLFTVSKSTGHAGTRIGWAIVKDLRVAQKMAKFIELNTIGVSKDAQIRATQILRSVTKAYQGLRDNRPEILERSMTEDVEAHVERQAIFHFGSSEMAYRWLRLRSALGSGVRFSVPELQSAFCTFFRQIRTPTPEERDKIGVWAAGRSTVPHGCVRGFTFIVWERAICHTHFVNMSFLCTSAFAWLRCNQEEDCEKFLKLHGILTRSGVHFGAEATYVRLSMLDRRSSFEILINRLEALERG